MATIIRAWRVENGGLFEIPELPADQQGLLENSLEDWLESMPDAIQDNLLLIGRQVETDSGPLDLLGLTDDGKIIIIELKRDRAPREAVAQAIDYASWVAAQTPEMIRTIATEYLKQSLDQAFLERFGQQLPEIQLSQPIILVVASRLDASTERMIQFLSKQYGMEIDGLVFRYICLPNDERILVRTSVVSEPRQMAGDKQYRLAPEMLVTHARERSALNLLQILRRLNEFLYEEPVRTYGGSFRYWGQNRMLCGVNVVTYWDAPPGVIDVWVSHGKWALVAGLNEESLVADLRTRFKFVKTYEGSRQMVLRIGSEDEANQFVALLRQWFDGSQDENQRAEGATDK